MTPHMKAVVLVDIERAAAERINSIVGRPTVKATIFNLTGDDQYTKIYKLRQHDLDEEHAKRTLTPKTRCSTHINIGNR